MPILPAVMQTYCTVH